MSAALHVVGPADLKAPTATLADRIVRLQADLAALNAEQLSVLHALSQQLTEIAASIAENRTQPPGIRDEARRLSEDCETRIHSISAIAARSRS
jgi:hypothetical protein